MKFTNVSVQPGCLLLAPKAIRLSWKRLPRNDILTYSDQSYITQVKSLKNNPDESSTERNFAICTTTTEIRTLTPQPCCRVMFLKQK